MFFSRERHQLKKLASHPHDAKRHERDGQVLRSYMALRPSQRDEVVKISAPDFSLTKHNLNTGWRLVPITAMSLAVLVMMFGGVAYASAQSLPTSSLYQVKLALEQVQLALASSPEAKVRVHLAMARERLNEVTKLVATKTKDVFITDTLIKYQNQVTLVTNSVPTLNLAPLVKEAIQLEVWQDLSNQQDQLVALTATNYNIQLPLVPNETPTRTLAMVSPAVEAQALEAIRTSTEGQIVFIAPDINISATSAVDMKPEPSTKLKLKQGNKTTSESTPPVFNESDKSEPSAAGMTTTPQLEFKPPTLIAPSAPEIVIKLVSEPPRPSPTRGMAVAPLVDSVTEPTPTKEINPSVKVAPPTTNSPVSPPRLTVNREMVGQLLIRTNLQIERVWNKLRLEFGSGKIDTSAVFNQLSKAREVVAQTKRMLQEIDAGRTSPDYLGLYRTVLQAYKSGLDAEITLRQLVYPATSSSVPSIESSGIIKPILPRPTGSAPAESK